MLVFIFFSPPLVTCMVFCLFCMHMRYRIYRLNNTKLYRRGEEKEWQNKIKLHRQSKNQHTRLSPSLLTSHSCVVATALFLSRTFPPASQDIPPLICPVLPFHCSRGHVSQPASQPVYTYRTREGAANTLTTTTPPLFPCPTL